MMARVPPIRQFNPKVSVELERVMLRAQSLARTYGSHERVEPFHDRVRETVTAGLLAALAGLAVVIAFILNSIVSTLEARARRR